MINEIITILDSVDKNIKVEKVRYTYNDTPIPSVTQILSKCIAEEYLLRWANHLGFKRVRYSDQVGLAATIGTDTHDSIEKYLDDGTECDIMGYKSFRLWWDMLNANHTTEIIGMEQELVLPYCAGKYDLLLKIDDKIYLVDFKTSNHISYKYFIQLAAYRHMIYAIHGINIDGCLILQLDKETPSFEEFTLDFSNPEHYNFIEHCAFTFMGLALSYYNINKAEKLFKQIF